MDILSSSKDLPIIMLLQRHLRSLKNKYRNAIIFLYAEANMSWNTIDRFAYSAKEVSPDIRIVSRDRSGKGKPGVETGEVEKQLMKDAIEEGLLSEAFVYAKDFVSDNVATTQVKFEHQLHQFRRMVHQSKDGNVFSKPKITYSGAGQDDTIMAMGLALIHSRFTRSSEEYQREAALHNLDI
jgi:hypothetical protein